MIVEDGEFKKLVKKVKELESQIEMMHLDMELFNRKNLRDVKELNNALIYHSDILTKLKPVYDDYQNRKKEDVKEIMKIYG